MKKITELINETRGSVIDQQWMNDNKPVMTKDGRRVVITSFDITRVPNQYTGQVMDGDKMIDGYVWDDDGVCTTSIDRYGNPRKPSDDDSLVKAE